MAAAAMLALDDLNAMDEDAFVAALGGVFEHSPWVARDAFARRPFASVSELAGAAEAAMRAAPRARQLDLIRAHPELAGREARAGELTAGSAGEQARAGLHPADAGRGGGARPADGGRGGRSPGAQRRVSRALRLPARRLRARAHEGLDPRVGA